MLRYKDYILENLLLESKIMYSDKFVDVLRGMKDPIASELLRLRGQDKDVAQNWISMEPNSNDTVRFVQDNKAKKMMDDVSAIYRLNGEKKHLKTSKFKEDGNGEEINRRAFSKLNMTFNDVNKADSKDDLIITGEVASEEDPTKVIVSYTCVNDPTKKGVINKEGLSLVDNTELITKKIWASKGNPLRIGRLAKALLQFSEKAFTDADIEVFVNAYKTRIDRLNNAFAKFSIVNGKDIAYWYSAERYSRNAGTLGNSCMKNARSDFFNIYVTNPSVCSMVILFDNNGKFEGDVYISNRILGRALLWKTSTDETFMDRIYTAADADVTLFKQFADSNGWWYKDAQNSNVDFTLVNNGVKKPSSKSPIIVDLENTKFDRFPFMDTLAYMSKDKISCSTVIKPSKQMRSADGSYQNM